MILSLALWVALLLVAMGIGRFTLRLLRASARERVLLDAFEQAWLGVAVMLGLWGIVSLVAPIGLAAMLGACGLAALGWVLTGVRLRARHFSARAALRLACCVIAGLFIAQGANAPVVWWDTLSTHLQQVKWIHTYAAVPGLANFSPKLGFDQLHFLLGAALDEGPLAGATVHIVNGFFVALFAWQWIATLLRPTTNLRQERVRLYALLTLPLLLHKAQFDRELASFAGDLIVAIVAAVFGKVLVALGPIRTARAQSHRRHRQQLLLATTLGAFLLAAKLNGAAFVLAAILLLVHGRKTAPAQFSFREVARLTAPALVILGAFFLRRAILTGWLLYPIPFGNLFLPWSVPIEELRYQQCWIRSWSRIQFVDCHDVLEHGFARWFYPWFATFSKFKEWRLFVGTMVITVALLGARTKLRQTHAEAILAITLTLSLALWFWGAPDWRFAVGFFWMLFAWAMTRLLWHIPAQRTRLVIATVVVLALAWDFGTLSPKLAATSWTALGPAPVVPYQAHTLAVAGEPPLPIYTPDGDDRCGDAPLPCTPYPAQQKLRVAGDLRHGFLPARSNSLHDHAVEDPVGESMPRRVLVDLETEGSDAASWYWSPNGAFSEAMQTTLPYTGRGKLEWKLPPEARHHRLDPGARATRYRIHAIDIECATTPPRTDHLDAAAIERGIAEAHALTTTREGTTLLLESTSADPYLVLTLPPCTKPQ